MNHLETPLNILSVTAVFYVVHIVVMDWMRML